MKIRINNVWHDGQKEPLAVGYNDNQTEIRKVKVEDRWYDTQIEEVIVELTMRDRTNIANMGTLKIYCEYPDGTFTKEQLLKWMKE